MKAGTTALLLCCALGVIVSPPAQARSVRSDFAAAANGLDKMSADLCKSLRLKCSKPRQAKVVTRKPKAKQPVTAKAKPSVTVKPASAPVPKAKPEESVASATAAPANPVQIKSDESAVPTPQAKPEVQGPSPAPVEAKNVTIEPPPVPPVPQARPVQRLAVLMPASPPQRATLAEGCEASLLTVKARFEPVSREAEREGCHIEQPVRLLSVSTPSGDISLPEGPVFNCRFAREFALWLSDTGSAVVLAQTKEKLAKVATGPGFECRRRNGDTTAKMSEHAIGNAVDITTITLASGRTIHMADAINPASPSYPVLRALRTTACGYFSTVLGPGANAAHKEHFHFDLGVHGKSGNYKICE